MNHQHYAEAFGHMPRPGVIYAPQIEIYPEKGQVSNEDLVPDPWLPIAAIDSLNPTKGIVMSPGRFVSVGFSSDVSSGVQSFRMGRTSNGRTPLTLFDGKNLRPAGVTVNKIYKPTGGLSFNDQNDCKYKWNTIIEVPHVVSVNDAYGTLDAGDYVTGYWGSTDSVSVISYIHRGKPVKWVAETTYRETAGAASAVIFLNSATNPGITPKFVAAYGTGGTLLTDVTATFGWSDAEDLWKVTFGGAGSATVQSVLYEYGQKSDLWAGRVVRLQNLNDLMTESNFLKWVEMAPNDFMNFPPLTAPAYQRLGVTAVTNETPTSVVAGSRYRVANYPMAIDAPVTVEVSGATIVDYNGASSSPTGWFALPTGALDQRGYFYGLYHSINWKTGILELASNITSLQAVRISYSYVTNPRDGAVIWGAGIENLTDGRLQTEVTQGAGLPAHLNFADVVAAMRVEVR